MIPLPYKIGIYFLAALLIFGAGWAGAKIGAAEEKGKLEIKLATANATLTGLELQQKDLREQVKKSDEAAARIPPFITQWHRDTNSIPIAPGCEAAVAFTRLRVPVLITHRKQEIFQ
jgi:hypothetical protein